MYEHCVVGYVEVGHFWLCNYQVLYVEADKLKVMVGLKLELIVSLTSHLSARSNMLYALSTEAMFHFEMSELNLLARENISLAFLRLRMSHAPMSGVCGVGVSVCCEL